ncbi:Nucleosome assembly protein 12 [Balamuthia mandrillaris]
MMDIRAYFKPGGTSANGQANEVAGKKKGKAVVPSGNTSRGHKKKGKNADHDSNDSVTLVDIADIPKVSSWSLPHIFKVTVTEKPTSGGEEMVTTSLYMQESVSVRSASSVDGGEVTVMRIDSHACNITKETVEEEEEEIQSFTAEEMQSFLAKEDSDDSSNDDYDDEEGRGEEEGESEEEGEDDDDDDFVVAPPKSRSSRAETKRPTRVPFTRSRKRKALAEGDEETQDKIDQHVEDGDDEQTKKIKRKSVIDEQAKVVNSLKKKIVALKFLKKKEELAEVEDQLAREEEALFALWESSSPSLPPQAIQTRRHLSSATSSSCNDAQPKNNNEGKAVSSSSSSYVTSRAKLCTATTSSL